LICLYFYQYLLHWDILYIIVNELMSTFQHKFNCVNLFSCSWDISRQSFYSYWWPDISVICCCFYTSYICADSPHLGLSSTTYFVKIGPLIVKIQAEWSLWQYCMTLLFQNVLICSIITIWLLLWNVMWQFVTVWLWHHA